MRWLATSSEEDREKDDRALQHSPVSESGSDNTNETKSQKQGRNKKDKRKQPTSTLVSRFVAAQCLFANFNLLDPKKIRILRKRKLRKEKKQQEIKQRIQKRKALQKLGWDRIQLHPMLREAVERRNWKRPTDIQVGSFTPIVKGRNVRSKITYILVHFVPFLFLLGRWLGRPQRAQARLPLTDSRFCKGKRCSWFWIIETNDENYRVIQRLSDAEAAGKLEDLPKGRPQVLILSPTRELANQVAEELRNLSLGTNVSVMEIYGGVDNEKQVPFTSSAVANLILICLPSKD